MATNLIGPRRTHRSFGRDVLVEEVSAAADCLRGLNWRQRDAQRTFSRCPSGVH